MCCLTRILEAGQRTTRTTAPTPGQARTRQRRQKGWETQALHEPGDQSRVRRLALSSRGHGTDAPSTEQPRGAQNDVPAVTRRLFSSIRSLQGTGHPLSRLLRSYFEPRLGHDLRQVRIHSNAHAQEAAQRLNPQAFTLGPDIVLGPGAAALTSDRGKRLLAHELAHVTRQQEDRGASRHPGPGIDASPDSGSVIRRMVTRLPQGTGRILPPGPAPGQVLGGMGCLLNRYPASRLLLSLPVFSCRQVSSTGFTINLLSTGLRGRRLYVKGGTWLDIASYANTPHTIIFVLNVQLPSGQPPGSAGSSTLTFHPLRPCRILRINFPTARQQQTGYLIDLTTLTLRPVTICP